jgi:hypothetical protein
MPGEKAGLGKTQQETEDEEAHRAADKCKRAGHDAPSNHDTGDPATCADPFQDQVARHLQQEIAPEESTRS